jgi:hypothetical protein
VQVPAPVEVAFQIMQALIAAVAVISPLAVSPVLEEPAKFVNQIAKRKIAAAPNYERVSLADFYMLIFIS